MRQRFIGAKIEMNSSAELEAQIAQTGGWPRRYTVVALLALATAICYVDRVNISIAIIPLAHDRGYDAAASGLILSSFFWGYIGPQMLGGWLADRFGGKHVLTIGVLLWTLGTLLTPAAAELSFGALLAMRAVLGLGESVHFPTVHSLAARWTISSERSRAISLYVSGVSFGTAVALLASPVIVLSLGWPAVFYISGVLGAIWLVVWVIKAADVPERCAGVTAQELAMIQADRPQAPLAESIPWAAILREKSVWAIVIAHVCNNFGGYIILLWLPSYLHTTFGIPMARLGSYSIIPWIAAFCVGNLSGWIADGLRKRGMTMTGVRKLMQSAAFILGAVSMLLLPLADSALLATVLVMIAIGGGSFGVAGFAVNHLDVAPQYAGILMGLSNTFAQLPGIVGVALTGFIVKLTHSFAGAFYLIAVINMVGMTCYLAMGSGERQL
jgi:MFS transporter, ACS family, solute carrier family 17 (sodium-dependent inorganic phosphate cotransporter), other